MFHKKTDTKSKPQNLKPDFIAKVLTLFSNRNQRGATLPIAVALGVVMIGIAGIAIMNSGRNKTNVASDEQAKQAMAAAEAGVARIQALLVENPKLAVIGSNGWVDVANGEIPEITVSHLKNYNVVVSDVATLSIERVDNNLFAFLPNEIILAQNKGNGNGNGGSTIGGTTPSGLCSVFAEDEINQGTPELKLTQEEVDEIQPELTNQVGSVSGSTFEPTSLDGNSGATFQLVSYSFDGDPDSGGTGTLVIDGKYGSSEARIEVKLPVTVKNNKIENAVPLPEDFPDKAGLWAQNFSISGGGNLTINSDILDASDCVVGGISWTAPPSTAFTLNGKHRTDYNISFPPLPLPLNQNKKFDIPTSDISTINSCNLTPTTSASYKYTGSCSTLTVDVSGGKTVKIYSDVAVPTVNATGLNDNPGSVIIYSNGGLSFGKSGTAASGNQWKHIQYYVASGDVTTKGNLTSSGFIFAPNSSFAVSGGGQGTHTGPIWANSIDISGGGNGTMNISMSRSDFEYLEPFTSESTIISIGSPQQQKRVEVQ